MKQRAHRYGVTDRSLKRWGTMTNWVDDIIEEEGDGEEYRSDGDVPGEVTGKARHRIPRDIPNRRHAYPDYLFETFHALLLILATPTKSSRRRTRMRIRPIARSVRRCYRVPAIRRSLLFRTLLFAPQSWGVVGIWGRRRSHTGGPTPPLRDPHGLSTSR